MRWRYFQRREDPMTPIERTRKVAVDVRVATIGRETRTAIVAAEQRKVTVSVELRTSIVSA